MDKADRKEDKSKTSPIFLLCKKEPPTVEIKKAGDGEEQKALARIASLSEISFLFFKSLINLLPTGNPEIKDIKKQDIIFPLVLNIFPENLLKYLSKHPVRLNELIIPIIKR